MAQTHQILFPPLGWVGGWWGDNETNIIGCMLDFDLTDYQKINATVECCDAGHPWDLVQLMYYYYNIM